MIEIEKPSSVISLATNSILLAVETHMWAATKQDKKSSKEVTDAKGASEEAASVQQKLLAGNVEHKNLIKFRAHVHNWINRVAYPWAGQMYIAPVVRLPDIMREYADLEKKFYNLRDAFMGTGYSNYRQIVSDMAFKMGSMFDASNYPDPMIVESRFSMRLYTSEVPTGDYRVQIAEDIADDVFNTVKKNTQRQLETYISEIQEAQVGQLIKVMESIAHCAADKTKTLPDGTTKIVRGKIYESTINQALELCDTFKTFNLRNDAELEQARASLEQVLKGSNIDTLRDSDGMRAHVKQSVEDILAKFRPPV